MKKYVLLCGFLLSVASTASSQVYNADNNEMSWAQQHYQEFANDRLNDEQIRKLRGYMSNSSKQKKARNIMLVYEVAGYKLGDEKLAKQYAALEENRQYQKKLMKIREQLSNRKISNSKNKEVIRILDDAGNRLYNLLAN